MLIGVARVLITLFVSSFALAAGKRGLGWPWDNTDDPAVFGNGKGEVSWIYNWESWEPSEVPSKMQYVSTARVASSGAAVAGDMANTDSKVLLCLNEPDNSGQADMTVVEAVHFFQEYCEPMAKKGVSVIAPAVTNGGSPAGLTFLDNFLKQCTGCTISGINLHWYGTETSDLREHIKRAMEMFPDKEIWVGEFGLDGTSSANTLKKFLTEAMAFLDETKAVTHYAYFGAFEGGMLTNGKLNKLGQTYRKA